MNYKTAEEIKAFVEEQTGREVSAVLVDNWITDSVEIDTDGQPPSDSFEVDENELFYGDYRITSHNMPIHIRIVGHDGNAILDQDGEIANTEKTDQLLKSVSLDQGANNGKGVTVNLNGVIVKLIPVPKFSIGQTVAASFLDDGVTMVIDGVTDSVPFTYSGVITDTTIHITGIPEDALIAI